MASNSPKVGIVFDVEMLKHKSFQPHPERPMRIYSIYHELKKQNLLEKCIQIPSRHATREELQLAHTPQHIDKIASWSALCEQIDGDGELSPTGDTYVNKHTSNAASLSAGSAVALTQQVVKGAIHSGFAIIRPPGHHAEASDAMGFCMFNNAVVCAKVARKMGLKRVLIVDWDVHHGNGTQHILETDPTVLYMSLHGYGPNFYPQTGGMKEVGKAEGTGFNVNVPWSSAGMGDKEYIACFQKIFLPIAKEFAPELVIVSAGFDCAKGDHMAGMQVTPYGFAMMTKLLSTLANGKLVILLEGGYNLRAISKSAAECVRVLLHLPPNREVNKEDMNIKAPAYASPRAQWILSRVVKVQSKHWKCLKGDISRNSNAYNCAVITRTISGEWNPSIMLTPKNLSFPRYKRRPSRRFKEFWKKSKRSG